MFMTRKLWAPALALYAACLVLPARAADADKLTPADAQIVMVFNIRQALESPLAKKHKIVDMIKSKLDSNAETKEAMAALGLDITKDIESMSMAGSMKDLEGGNPQKALITVRGNFDSAKLEAAARTSDKVKISKAGDRTVFELPGDKGGKTAFVTFAGKGTICVSPSKDYLLKCLAGGGASKELSQASERVNAKQTMWVAMVVTDEMRKKMGDNPQFAAFAKIESINLGVDVTTDIMVNLNMNTGDPDTAKAIKAQLDLLIPGFKAFIPADEKTGPVVNAIFDNLKVGATGPVCSINLKISEETLDKIIKLAQGAGR